MNLPRKRALLLLAVLAVAGLLATCLVAVVVLGGRAEWEGFQQVRAGMTQAQVTTLVGREPDQVLRDVTGDTRGRPPTAPGHFTVLVWHVGGSATLTTRFTPDDRLIDKEWRGTATGS